VIKVKVSTPWKHLDFNTRVSDTLNQKYKFYFDEVIEKEFDFSKVEPRVVTINLDTEIIEYFKNLAGKTGKGYQVLIKDALKYFIEEKIVNIQYLIKKERKVKILLKITIINGQIFN
jgi:uncharacterized protein (DUF4415 family)